MTDLIPAISLWQPWASLWMVRPRVKIDETRSRPLPRRIIGRRILVHAALKRVRVEGELDDLCRRRFGSNYHRDLPRGGYLGSMMMHGFRGIDINHPDLLWSAGTGENLICGDWSDGRFAWRGVDPITFPALVPARGQQGFWNVDRDSLPRAA